jgi:hypothetical protein
LCVVQQIAHRLDFPSPTGEGRLDPCRRAPSTKDVTANF